MEHSPIKYPGDEDDVEDGQISDGSDDDGVYIPLARPAEMTTGTSAAGSGGAGAAANGQQQMDADKDDDDEDEDSDDQASDDTICTDSDSDNALIGEVRHKMRRKLRVKPLRPLNNKSAAADNSTSNTSGGGPTQPTATSSPAASATASSGSVSVAAAATSGAPTAPVAGAPRRRNNIWATGLQEENLLENLKGCGVDRAASSAYDRSVESYDYSLRFRLNGENALKRRKSSNSDSSNDRPPSSKRFYLPATGGGGGGGGGNPHQHGPNRKHRSVRQRLGQRRSLDQDTNSSNSNDAAAATLDGPRIIEDLDAGKVAAASESSEVIAAELAGKLHEEKDELMLRIVQILGVQLPLAIFAETQRVEADGGMRIMNGKRRRTPGGVFLFLLKNSADLSAESRRAIFTEESRKQNREQKLAQAQKRDRKVEQLKQTLRIESEAHQQLQQKHQQQQLTPKSEATGVAAAAAAALAAVSGSRGLRDETLNNLSNPPPSPVTDGNRENSSDYDTHHHINAEQQLEAATDDAKCAMRAVSSATAAAANSGASATAGGAGYEEDFLDMHCDDMDLF